MKTIAAPSPGLRLGRQWLALGILLPFVLLGIGWLLPSTGVGAAFRLAGAGAIVLLVPGALVQQALGRPAAIGVAAAGALAWSLAVLFVALALTFLVEGSLTLTLVLVLAAAAGAAVVPRRGSKTELDRHDARAALGVLLASMPLAIAGWIVYRTAAGDSLFHIAYARKLEELGSLESLEAIGQFAGGGLHPGYAFPLWHGALGAIARLAGVDVGYTVVHLGPLLLPLVAVVVYGLGTVLFRSWAGGVALAAAFVGLVAFTGERLGLVEALSDPEAAARALLVPGLLALVFAYARERSRAALASVVAASLALVVIHPNYMPYTGLALAGCIGAHLLVLRRREEVDTGLALGLGAMALTALVFLAWLWPTVSDAGGIQAGTAETARSLANYPGFFEGGPDSFRVDPEAIARRGGLVVLALLAVPLAGLAGRRLWACFVLGGSLLVLSILLIPPVFTAFADLVSVSQSRRLVGFLPLPFALAGAAVLAGRFRAVGALAALGIGIVAALALPADGALVGAWPVWVAYSGAALGLAYAAWRRPAGPHPGIWAAAAAVAVILPFAVATAADLSREDDDRLGLSPGLTEALRANTAPDDVVLSRPELSYRISAAAPVFIVAAPLSHGTDTETSKLDERLADTALFYAPASAPGARLAVLDKYGVGWVVLDKERGVPEGVADIAGEFQTVYEDGRYVLLRTGVS